MKQITAILFISAILLTSCTDAQQSKIAGLGSKYKIELINCDGTVARTWISSGKVLTEQNSDGYYFNDSSTGQLVEVTGTLIITQL